MVKVLPDSYIRKAISEAINNIDVDGYIIPCFDTRVVQIGNSDIPESYILMTTQSNEIDKSIKCGYRWESQILLDITTCFDLRDNTSSRLLADNILNIVRQNTDSLTLDAASGLEIVTQNQSFPSDISTTTANEIIFRKFIRIEFLIN